MSKRKLSYRFHNPNPAELSADYILAVLTEANQEKAEAAVQAAMLQEKSAKDEEEPA